MALKTVKVPEDLEPIFAKAEAAVSSYFAKRADDPCTGTIEICNERYVLVRAASLSIEFFSLVRGLFGPGQQSEADEFARNILFDLAHAIGKSDAQSFRDKMRLKDPLELLSAGPIHFSHSGWAFVDILTGSRPTPDADYYLIYDHPYSFEADAWITKQLKPDFPVCIMNAGYSSGWCEASFGLPLTASEILCRAKGDPCCRFIMAPPERIEQHVNQYLGESPRPPEKGRTYIIPDFFARKRAEEALREAHYALERKVEERTAELQKANKALEAEIVERRRVEQALHESEGRYRAIVEDQTELICRFLPDTRISFVNEAYCRYFGKRREELIGQSFLPLIPEADRGFVEKQIASLSAEHPILTHEHRVTKSGGAVGWHQWSNRAIFDHQGRIMEYQAVGRDITERKQIEEALTESEARFRMLTESGLVGVYILQDGAFQYVNPALAEIVGYHPDELIGLQAIQLAHPEDRAKASDLIRQRLDGEIEVARYTCRLICKSGAVKEVEVLGRRILYKGRPAVMGTLQDTTERKQAEEQLRHAQKMEAVGRLSGGIAHDFNNLLTVILGNVQLALMEIQGNTTAPHESRLATALQDIERAAEWGAQLTGQLLTFSRKHVEHMHVLDAVDIVQGIESMLRRLIGEDIAIEISYDPGEHLIRADKAQIEQILLNLTVNARDAMPHGGKLTIRVTGESLDQASTGGRTDAKPGPHVLIAASDTGMGMDQSILDHIFEPFFTTKPFGQGTGLGLAIAYGIVKQAGGHIAVESEPGQGSTFRLYFPAAQRETPELTKPKLSDGQRGDETILLCEDEGPLRRMAAAILAQQGYRVIEAENGEQAMRLTAEHEGPIHLLITDVVMPEMKGDLLAATIQKDRPRTQVLFMSGYASDILNLESVLEKGCEFLQKPFKPEVLLRRVRDLLDRIVK